MEVTEEVLRNETGLIEVIFELIDRGVLLDEIDAAMNMMIGADWPGR